VAGVDEPVGQDAAGFVEAAHTAAHGHLFASGDLVVAEDLQELQIAEVDGRAARVLPAV
jgi:hypothetical protein